MRPPLTRPLLTRPPLARRAFTLLELLLALSVLAAMSVLIATLWRQASDWASDAATFDGAMRLPRAAELARSQWAERRTSVILDEQGRSLGFTPERLSFVTALPVLFVDSPLVKVEYIIDTDPRSSSSFPLRRLRCSETPVVDVLAAQNPSASPGPSSRARPLPSSVQAPEARVITLLEGCATLTWEWFGEAADPEASEPDSAASTSATPASASKSAARSGSSSARSSSSAGAEPDAESPPSLNTRPQWHQLIDGKLPPAKNVRALRLVGTLGKEDVLWIFPGAASR